MVNLFALLFLARELVPVEFAHYSTVVATVMLLANVLYGPIAYPLVRELPRFQARDNSEGYLGAVQTALAGLSAVLATLCCLLWAMQFERVASAGMLLMAFGIFRVSQEWLRATLSFRGFALQALVQALVFFGLLSVGAGTSGYVWAVQALLASYLVSALPALWWRSVAWRLPDADFYHGVRAIGVPYVQSTLVENVLGLGTRYLVGWFGSEQQFARYSFCLDLVQRSVGFVVNLTSFVSVPQAFHRIAGERNGTRSMLISLLPAALMASALATLVVLGVMAAYWAGLFRLLEVAHYAPVSFVLLAVAVYINRLKKLLCDPLAMQLEQVGIVTRAYAVAAVVALPTGALMISFWGGRIAPELTYLLGCVLAAVITAGVINRAVQGGAR